MALSVSFLEDQYFHLMKHTHSNLGFVLRDLAEAMPQMNAAARKRGEKLYREIEALRAELHPLLDRWPTRTEDSARRVRERQSAMEQTVQSIDLDAIVDMVKPLTADRV